ncbi:MAG: AAA domain-containing protein [Firmicutes bacterium]|nr:AAA domain-containing protein [Bacillota bacterium]
MKKIYKFYKDRLIEISGKNRSLYAKKASQTYTYDIGKILEGDEGEIESFVNFLWSAKKPTHEIISKKRKEHILENLKKSKATEAKKAPKGKNGKTVDAPQEEKVKSEAKIAQEERTLMSSQVSKLKNLKRSLEDFERETGRYEMFVGFPFIEGYIGKDTAVKAPLLLFPVVINISENESTVSLELKDGEAIQLNKVFLTAYSRPFKINLDEMNMEFDSLLDAGFRNVDDILGYLRKKGFDISSCPSKKGMMSFDSIKEPTVGSKLTVRNCAVVGRFPLANSIYNDYVALEKKNLSNEAIAALLENKTPKKLKNVDKDVYTVHSLDYAQENAIAELNQHGNMVIYGPPGTGKSQTIVNTITDALCKNKRVLVVSQKKAALDVVFNRLGNLNSKAMYIIDPEKEKLSFFEKVKTQHLEILGEESVNTQEHRLMYQDVTGTLHSEIAHLESISQTLFSPTDFGISLQEMYARSRIINKGDGEYDIYESMLDTPRLMELSHKQLSESIRSIKEKKKGELYYKRIEMQKANPFVEHVKKDLDVHTLNAATTYLNNMLSKRFVPFDMSQFSFLRQLIGFYIENNVPDIHDLKPLIKYSAKRQEERISASEMTQIFSETLEEAKAYVGEWYLLSRILDSKGFATIIDHILMGNLTGIKLLLSALNQYVDIRDMNINLRTFSDEEKIVLKFAYENSVTVNEYNKIIDNILSIRIYHEIVLAEATHQLPLSKIMDFENIKNRIISLKAEQQKVVREICEDNFKNEYKTLYNSNPENNNFFYQISKSQNFMPIRKLVELYHELLFTLYPCWLLSPESVSTLLPLKAGLFDLILFDEASQVFIEAALPTIYRGKNIAIAGDNKQLRPTAHFLRRFMGNDDDDMDMNTVAALEVESLLDLATSRFHSANLNYHYRSRHEELINFSNYAYYHSKLQVAPNMGRNMQTRPIERIKVDGRWIDRRNEAEAKRIVELIKKTLKSRKNNETIGVITFNAEQGTYINDLIDEACMEDANFRSMIYAERNRFEHGEDVSLFVKNLENVQGDERDIIIFSVGYAKNEHDKVTAHFGPLNLEGGENRLNVAVTRAKSKIYLVTSIEPEELNVESAKNLGPKLFKRYLEYARSVSTGATKEVKLLLSSLASSQTKPATECQNITTELKTALEKMGYIVDVNVGNSTSKLSLAIYDKDLDRYVLGIECDYDAYASSPSVLERDVFRAKFLESRGWNIVRIWSRDFWISKSKVLNGIDKIIKEIKSEALHGKKSKSEKKIEKKSEKINPNQPKTALKEVAATKDNK